MDNDTATAATIESLRDALDASHAREEAYRADVVRLTGERDAARQALNDTDMELAKAMSRADVLAAEVKAWRDWHGFCGMDEPDECTCEPNRVNALNFASAETDSTNALDPAKFEEQP